MSGHGSGGHDHGPGNIEKTLARFFAGTIVAIGSVAKSMFSSIFNFLLSLV